MTNLPPSQSKTKNHHMPFLVTPPSILTVTLHPNPPSLQPFFRSLASSDPSNFQPSINPFTSKTHSPPLKHHLLLPPPPPPAATGVPRPGGPCCRRWTPPRKKPSLTSAASCKPPSVTTPSSSLLLLLLQTATTESRLQIQAPNRHETCNPLISPSGVSPSTLTKTAKTMKKQTPFS